MSFEYDGYEWVAPEASGRRGGYWRKIPDTREHPTYGQVAHRLAFSEAAVSTKGLYGTEPTSDGRQFSRSAIALGEMLRSPADQYNESEQDMPVQDIPDVPGTATTRQIDEIAAAPAPQFRPQDEMFDILMKHAIAEREKHEANRLALLEKERELYTERMKQDFERSKAAVDERMKRTESLIRKLNTPSNKTEDAALSRLKKQIEEIQHKLEEKTVPKPIIKAPEIPPLPPIPNKTADDLSSSTFLGCAFAGATLLGLVAWGAKDVRNMATVSDIVHIANTALNPVRPAPPFNKP